MVFFFKIEKDSDDFWHRKLTLKFFDSSSLIQNSKFNHFLWVCWFLGKNLSNFVPPVWKLHNPYCHNKEPDSPVLSYQNQIEDVHVDTDTLKKRANFAHDFRQLPFLCQSRIELERCAEKGNHYVAEGQVSNQNVVYILQGFCSANNPQNQSIAITWCGNCQPVNQNQESDQTWKTKRGLLSIKSNFLNFEKQTFSRRNQ